MMFDLLIGCVVTCCWVVGYYIGKALVPITCWPLFVLKDIYACFRYQCLGFGKNCKTGKQVPMFKVKTNVVYLGLTFISHRKAKKVNNAR